VRTFNVFFLCGQILGFDVDAVNSVQFSNHTGIKYDFVNIMYIIHCILWFLFYLHLSYANKLYYCIIVLSYKIAICIRDVNEAREE